MISVEQPVYTHQDTKPDPLDLAKKNDLKNGVPTNPVELERLGKHVEWKMRQTLGLYPVDHPVSNYAAQLLTRLSDSNQDKQKISVYKGPPNAFVFFHGATYVSDQLIQMAETDEEVLFAFMHERRHFLSQDWLRNSASSNARNLEEYILIKHGESRAHEWESDIRAFIDLDEKGINPLGGIDLMQKFQERSSKKKKKSTDHTHGKDTDRIINLQAITHLKDFKSLDKPLKPVDENIKQLISQEQKEDKYSSVYNKFMKTLQEGIYFRSATLADQLTKEQAIVALDSLRGLIQVAETKIEEFEDPASKHALALYVKIIPILSRKIWEQIRNEKPDTNEQTVGCQFYLTLNLGLGVPIDLHGKKDYIFHNTQDLKVRNNQGKDTAKWSKTGQGFGSLIQSKEDIADFLSTLDPGYFEQAHLPFITNSPEDLVTSLTQAAMDVMAFENDDGLVTEDVVVYIDQLITRLQKLYQDFSLDEVNSYLLKKRVLSVIAENIDPDELESLSQLVLNKNNSEVEREKLDVGTERLLEVWELLIAELKIEDQVKSNKIDLREQLTEESQQEYVENILTITTEEQISSPHDFLVFIAKLKNLIEKDSKKHALQGISSFQYHWNKILEKVAEKMNILEGMNESSKHIYLIKVQLLVENDTMQNASTDYLFELNGEVLSFDEFKELYVLFKQPNYLSKELGIEVNIQDSSDDPLLKSVLTSAAYSILQSELNISAEQFFQTLSSMVRDYPLNNYGTGEYELIKSGNSRKIEFLNKIFAEYSFDLTQNQDIRNLYYLTTYFHDSGLATRLQSILLDELVRNGIFEEGLEFIKGEVGERRLRSFSAVNDFIEENAKTHDQINQAGQSMVDILTGDRTMKDVGKLIVGELAFDQFFGKDKYELALGCIGNGKDDSMLKTELYKRWVNIFNVNRELISRYSFDLEDIITKLYRMDAQSKYVLIRDLLVGEQGIFMSKDESIKLSFVDFFLENYIEVNSNEDKEYYEVIRTILRQLVQSARYDQLYFVVSSILQDRFLMVPPNKTSWEEIIKKEKPPSGYESQIWSDFKEVDEKDIPALLNLVKGGPEIGPQMSESTEKVEAIKYTSTAEKFLEDKESPPEKQKLEVNEFILEISQKLGAPGVRFLQIVGQYIELPPELEETFNKVYDRMSGQSKISADATVLREWPDAKDTILSFDKRIGGGSLMSVFLVTLDTGEKRALKVLNPNSKHHTAISTQLLRDVFIALTAENLSYETATTLIEDIKNWIDADVDFENFLQQDARFKEKHNGFAIDDRYKIKIPTSYPPENKYFILEEYIEGTNLSTPEALESQGHDIKAIVKLIAMNFLEQVKDGQVHSDLHQGNIRVTENNEVVYLDRNFFLEFDFTDRMFLLSLQSSFDDPEMLADSCLDYADHLGISVTDDQKNRIQEAVTQLSEEGESTEKLMKLSIILRKEGIHLPLKITLLLKDLFYLDKMAKKAGFSGLQAATS